MSIIVLSVTPAGSQPTKTLVHWLVNNTPAGLQKALHVLAYALLTVVLLWAFNDFATQRARMALAAVLAIALGAILEWYQRGVAGRFGSLTDVLFDAGGAVLGIVAVLLLR